MTSAQENAYTFDHYFGRDDDIERQDSGLGLGAAHRDFAGDGGFLCPSGRKIYYNYSIKVVTTIHPGRAFDFHVQALILYGRQVHCFYFCLRRSLPQAYKPLFRGDSSQVQKVPKITNY